VRPSSPERWNADMCRAKADLASVLATDAILDRPPSEMPSFLRLSIVLYASFHRTITSGTAEDVRFRTRLLQAVRAGLSMSWSSIASTDVAFACLIIGLSPVTSQVDKMCDHPDPLGATTVAYNLISALGLADSVSYLRQVPVGELSAPWLRSHLYNMFMVSSNFRARNDRLDVSSTRFVINTHGALRE
jgi:hypothetical protein